LPIMNSCRSPSPVDCTRTTVTRSLPFTEKSPRRQDSIGGASDAGAGVSGDGIGSGIPLISIPIYATQHECKGCAIWVAGQPPGLHELPPWNHSICQPTHIYRVAPGPSSQGRRCGTGHQHHTCQNEGSMHGTTPLPY
jgi:hypothetical protein